MQSNKELSLWKLTNEHQKLLSELYNHETGEVNELVNAKLNSLYKTEEEKCIAVAHWLKKLKADRKQAEDELEDLKSRIEDYDKRIERYKRDIQSNMESRGITNISCPYFTIRLKKNPYSTDIINEGEIPSEFMRKRIIPEKIEIKPDKKAIADKVIATGHQVPGAYVSQKNKLDISTTKI